MNSRPVVVWFRDDLRIADNPALHAAAATGQPLITLYVLDDLSKELRPLGGAARWWLSRSLRVLEASLEQRGIALIFRRGPSPEVVAEVVREANASAVYWNRRVGNAATLDEGIEAALRGDDVKAEVFNGSLLFPPGSIRAKSGGAFRVFTPFWRAALSSGEPRATLPIPRKMTAHFGLRGDRLDDWRLEPTRPDWAAGLRAAWTPGEEAAKRRLANFVIGSLQGYAGLRDRPDIDCTSRLSPHLRFGEISPYQVWHAARAAEQSGGPATNDVERFLTELGWREFSYQLLHQFPDLATRNFQPRFDVFPWRTDEKALRRWTRGKTGFPIVDAGMRQLWDTGFMHNRVRMIVASFLVKHLLIDWREGEAWFWDTLVDADPANNAASWQWVAGSGADAAPYFRVFNPALQSEKFDPNGDYVRCWVPELAGTKATDLFEPPVPARRYPEPMVDHAVARARALAAFESLKSAEA